MTKINEKSSALPNFYVALGSRIRDRRTHLGKTQAQAAADAGIDRASLTNIENGKHKPSLDCFIALSQALEMDVSDFFSSSS